MALISAYFDESGDPGTHAVVVSGFAGSVDQWARFDDDWKRAHADFGLPDPSSHPFHMKDFAHSNGVFQSWRSEHAKRRDFIARLIGLIRVRAEFGFAFMVQMETYRAVNAVFPLMERSLAPYTLCASGCLFKSIRWADERGPLIKHVFADGARDKGKFIELINGISHFPIFGSMKEHLPLQAADLAAYECLRFRRDFVAINSGRQPARKSLLALFGSVPGQYMIADKPQIIDLCENLGLQPCSNAGPSEI